MGREIRRERMRARRGRVGGEDEGEEVGEGRIVKGEKEREKRKILHIKNCLSWPMVKTGQTARMLSVYA